jgi:predicted TIM-barrel fold metal-dependent hydrolase
MSQDTMLGDRVIVVSADCHGGPENVGDYEQYTPAVLRPALREYVGRIEAFEASRTQEQGAGGRGGAVTREDAGLWDIKLRSERLEADGVAAEVIFPQGSVPFAPYPAIGVTQMDWTPKPEQRDAGPAIYNRWLAELCSADPDLHFGVGVVPIYDVDAAATEVTRARELGLRGGVSLPPVRPDRPGYNNPVYDRLWAACQDHGMVLNAHGGSGMTYEGGPEKIAIILSETDFFSRRSLSYLIFGGVFERFPRLKMAFTEQRAHWVPGVLAELDSIYRSARCAEMRKSVPKLPSEYFATNCYVGASFMSVSECAMRYDIGVERIMWGSDYPHAEGVWPWVREGLRWTYHGVDERELRMMLGGNAIECYGFDANRLRQKAQEVGPTVDEIVDNPLASAPAEPGVELSWAFRTTAWS